MRKCPVNAQRCIGDPDKVQGLLTACDGLLCMQGRNIADRFNFYHPTT